MDDFSTPSDIRTGTPTFKQFTYLPEVRKTCISKNAYYIQACVVICEYKAFAEMMKTC